MLSFQNLFIFISVLFVISNALVLFAALQELQDLQGFQNMIDKKDRLVVVEFRSHRCAPCNLLEKKLLTLAEEHRDVDFGKVDISQLYDVFAKYDVRSLPTTIYFKNGEMRERAVGASNFSQIEGLFKKLITD